MNISTIHTSTEMRDATESSVSLQIGEKKKLVCVTQKPMAT